MWNSIHDLCLMRVCAMSPCCCLGYKTSQCSLTWLNLKILLPQAWPCRPVPPCPDLCEIQVEILQCTWQTIDQSWKTRKDSVQCLIMQLDWNSQLQSVHIEAMTPDISNDLLKHQSLIVLTHVNLKLTSASVSQVLRHWDLKACATRPHPTLHFCELFSPH